MAGNSLGNLIYVPVALMGNEAILYSMFNGSYKELYS